ncbi:hypothetical protein AC578_9388, partial [Pseudocercospora eumusae]
MWRELSVLTPSSLSSPPPPSKMLISKSSHKPNTPSKTPTETFTGTVHMDPVFTASDNSCMGNNVIFTPGARTFWHTHEHGQILSVTMGTGLICSKGQKARRLEVGDVVHVPGGEMHWHGGSCSTVMGHLAISLGKTSWHEEVDQKEYEEAN